MSAGTGPPTDERRPGRGSGGSSKRLGGRPECTTNPRQEWLAALPRQRTERVQELRHGLDDARLRSDHDQAARICRALDGEFVADAHRRAADPEIRRLRRQLRAAA